MQQMDNAGAVLRIDLDALVDNYRMIQRQVGPALVGGVVKADGYGLGAQRVAQILTQAGCRHFFVALLGEAMRLKPRLCADASLFVLNGLQPGAEAACAQAGIIPVLNSLDQIDRWAALARSLGRHLPAAIQVDSGMSRLGLPPDEVALLIAQKERMDGIALRLVMSHLACADEVNAVFNAEQVAAFEKVTQCFPDVPRSLDNSGGSFHQRAHFDLVRAGIALYGGAPANGPNPMRAVVSLEARIAQLRTVPTGSVVGYGASHRCDRETRIATIPVGYADGWPRHLSNCGSAFIGSVRVPIIGRVSMDSMTLDVSHVPQAHLYPGAPVELIGSHQSVDEVAADAGTISYEILTQLGPRYARFYRSASAAERKRSVAV